MPPYISSPISNVTASGRHVFCPSTVPTVGMDAKLMNYSSFSGLEVDLHSSAQIMRAQILSWSLSPVFDLSNAEVEVILGIRTNPLKIIIGVKKFTEF
jgi:hypothetical protein